jgi:hypothetical protein
VAEVRSPTVRRRELGALLRALRLERGLTVEQEATAIRQYQSTAIPGLLQTSDYARAMADVLVPEVSPERAAEFVEVKRRRQARLAGDPPLPLTAVLDEAVLHRAVGGPAVMGAQLDHLVEASEDTIRIIPYEAGAHPAMDSTFTIIQFTEPVPSVVYVEGPIGMLYIKRLQDITHYEQTFGNLCNMALNPREPTELVVWVRKLPTWSCEQHQYVHINRSVRHVIASRSHTWP